MRADVIRLVFTNNGLDCPMGVRSYQCWAALTTVVGGGATRAYSDTAVGTNNELT
jgi:hypothetical protein